MEDNVSDSLVSVEEYISGEEESEIRHEYIGGHVHAMSGGSEEHNLISGNLYLAIRNHLRGKSCTAFINDMKVRLNIARDDIFYYPDVLVTCDPTDDERYFKSKPSVIIEVLSPTTERLDRREKFLSYQRLASLQEYVLVDQEKPEVTLFQKKNNWDPEFQHAGGVLALPSLEFSLSLDEVYEGVSFQRDA